jgi:phospholipid transport system substrate-binding protein
MIFAIESNCHSSIPNFWHYGLIARNIEASMTVKLSRRKFGLGLTLLGVSASFAKADDQAALYVTKLGADVIRLANGGKRGDKELQHQFAALFTRYIGIPNVANFALGPYQKQLPAALKPEFYDLVANYAAALFVWYVEDFRGENLHVTNTAEQGKFITVDSEIQGGGLVTEKLRWRLVGSDGNFKIADLNVKGVWLTISMKKLFADTLRESNGDFQALFAKLREADSW